MRTAIHLSWLEADMVAPQPGRVEKMDACWTILAAVLLRAVRDYVYLAQKGWVASDDAFRLSPKFHLEMMQFCRGNQDGPAWLANGAGGKNGPVETMEFFRGCGVEFLANVLGIDPEAIRDRLRRIARAAATGELVVTGERVRSPKRAIAQEVAA